MKPKLKVMLSFILSLSLLLGSSVSASSIFNSQGEDTSSEELMLQYTYQPSQIENPDGEIVPNAGPLVGVAIFFGGIFVGWIIDGMLISATGQSGGEWAATALNYFKTNPGCSQIQITKAGHPYCGVKGDF